jgi:hypothetical protein
MSGDGWSPRQGMGWDSDREPSMVSIERSREAARQLWDAIGRLLAGDPFASPPMAPAQRPSSPEQPSEPHLIFG